MVWPQMLGETFQLTDEERLRGMDEITAAAKGRSPAVVLGVQGPNIKSALRFLEHAQPLDPDALIALPPTEAKTLADVMGYYRALGRATHLPVFIQNADLGSGIKPSVHALLHLDDECPNCGYLKEEVDPVILRMKH